MLMLATMGVHAIHLTVQDRLNGNDGITDYIQLVEFHYSISFLRQPDLRPLYSPVLHVR